MSVTSSDASRGSSRLGALVDWIDTRFSMTRMIKEQIQLCLWSQGSPGAPTGCDCP